MVEAVESWLGIVARCSKKYCRPGRAFAPGNLVPRVARRSLEFWASTFECTHRAPTNEGCRRWCLVHPDAWLSSREFPVPEMRVGVWRAHIWGQSSPSASRMPCYFRASTRTRIIISSLLARTSLSPLTMRSPREGRPTANRHWIRERL